MLIFKHVNTGMVVLEQVLLCLTDTRTHKEMYHQQLCVFLSATASFLPTLQDDCDITVTELIEAISGSHLNVYTI